MRGQPNAPMCLPSGVFLGRKLIQVDVNGLTLTASGYEPAARLPRHAHESAFFSVVLSGRYIEKLSRSERQHGLYSVAFHPPGEEHADHFHPSRAKTLSIELSSRWLERLRDAGIPLEPKLWTEGPPLWIAMRLHRELQGLDQASPLAIEGLVLELAGEAVRQRERRRPPSWLARVEERLRNAPLLSASVTELSRLAGVHPVHLARTFRRWHGCTCGEFVRRLRLAHAQARLATSAASLGEIALEAGFSDQSHFSRCFKRATGLTPGTYRARMIARHSPGPAEAT